MNRCSTVFVFMAMALVLCPCQSMFAAQAATGNQPATNSAGQTADAASTAQASAVPLEPSEISKGTTLIAEFSQGLNAGKLKPGDKVKAVLTQDLVVKGKIVAPVDSKLVGHVTEVKKSSGADPESRLGVVFDKVLLKHHKELPVEAAVFALLAPVIRRSRVDEPDQMMPPPVVASGNVNTSGRGGSSAGRSNNSGTATTSVASLNSIGAIPTVQSTPGSSSPGSRVSSTIDLKQINAKNVTASTGMRGVYGIKDISLSPPSNGSTVIISSKSNVKLENGTQLILVVLR